MLVSDNQNFIYIQIKKQYCNGCATKPQVDNSYHFQYLNKFITTLWWEKVRRKMQKFMRYYSQFGQ